VPVVFLRKRSDGWSLWESTPGIYPICFRGSQPDLMIVFCLEASNAAPLKVRIAASSLPYVYMVDTCLFCSERHLLS